MIDSILKLALLTVVSSATMLQAEAEGTTTIPYPFQPPSGEFCEHNKLGSDSTCANLPVKPLEPIEHIY